MDERREVLSWMRRVKRHDSLCAEQIMVEPRTEPPTKAALLDQWGRGHWLMPRTLIGREPGGCDVAILESSVSRAHARLEREAEEHTWSVTDLDSTNGTFVDGQRIEGSAPLSDGALVTFGDVSFVFHGRGAVLFDRASSDTISRTSKTSDPEHEGEPEGPRVTLLGLVNTGAGVVDYEGRFVELGPAQYALLSELAEAILEEKARADAVRGFVGSGELLELLPWKSPYPTDNHLKQLVRRTRRAFDRAGIEDPIESRHGYGYRLRWIPAIEAL